MNTVYLNRAGCALRMEREVVRRVDRVLARLGAEDGTDDDVDVNSALQRIIHISITPANVSDRERVVYIVVEWMLSHGLLFRPAVLRAPEDRTEGALQAEFRRFQTVAEQGAFTQWVRGLADVVANLPLVGPQSRYLRLRSDGLYTVVRRPANIEILRNGVAVFRLHGRLFERFGQFPVFASEIQNMDHRADQEQLAGVVANSLLAVHPPGVVRAAAAGLISSVCMLPSPYNHGVPNMVSDLGWGFTDSTNVGTDTLALDVQFLEIQFRRLAALAAGPAYAARDNLMPFNRSSRDLQRSTRQAP